MPKLNLASAERLGAIAQDLQSAKCREHIERIIDACDQLYEGEKLSNQQQHSIHEFLEGLLRETRGMMDDLSSETIDLTNQRLMELKRWHAPVLNHIKHCAKYLHVSQPKTVEYSINELTKLLDEFSAIVGGKSTLSRPGA